MGKVGYSFQNGTANSLLSESRLFFGKNGQRRSERGLMRIFHGILECRLLFCLAGIGHGNPAARLPVVVFQKAHERIDFIRFQRPAMLVGKRRHLWRVRRTVRNDGTDPRAILLVQVQQRRPGALVTLSLHTVAHGAICLK